MKKLLAILLAAVMLLGVVSVASAEDVKVAMITDYGDITDQSFNQTTYEAAKAFCEANGLDFQYYKPASDSDEDRISSIEKAIDDGFNTIITLEVILSDSVFFRCMDGSVRDLAALRGTYRLIPETDQAVHLLTDMLQEAKVRTVRILLDEPVSNSGRLKAKIADIAEGCPFGLDIRIQRDVDRELYDKELVVTSDSIILDHCRSWVNLTGEYLRRVSRTPLQVWEQG